MKLDINGNMKYIVYSLLIVLMTACIGKNGSERSNDTGMLFTTEEYKEKSGLVNTPDATLVAEIPVAGGDSIASKYINNKIFNTVKLIVSNSDTDTSGDYLQLFSGFINNYKKFITEYPDAPGAWEISIKGTVEYNTPEIINIKLDSYTMTGGAHGNGNKTSLLFDPQTGKELFLKDIVNDTVALARIAETKFREKYDIAPDKNINSTGFMFLNDAFVLPQNTFITMDGLLLYYNAYEIASYADGTKEIELPYNEIKNYLSVRIR